MAHRSENGRDKTADESGNPIRRRTEDPVHHHGVTEATTGNGTHDTITGYGTHETTRMGHKTHGTTGTGNGTHETTETGHKTHGTTGTGNGTHGRAARATGPTGFAATTAGGQGLLHHRSDGSSSSVSLTLWMLIISVCRV